MAASKNTRAKKLAVIAGRIQELARRQPPVPFLSPLSPQQLGALEKTIGTALPAEYRDFLGTIAAGEAPRQRGLVRLLTPAEGLASLAAPGDARERFPASPAITARLSQDIRNRKPQDRVPSLDAPIHGLLPLTEESDSSDCLVLSGPLGGSMWQSWDQGISPLITATGKPRPLTFLEWLGARLDEALAASAPTTPEATKVNLGVQGLDAIPDYVLAARSMEVLLLHGNKIATLPDGLAKLTSLRELVLGGNRLKVVPDWIGELRALRKLSLELNLIEELPEAIVRLEHLEDLRLGGNKLKELPSSLGKLSQLRQLDVSGNALRQLPASIADPPELRLLKLAKNPLTSLPSSFARLRLEELELTDLPQLDMASTFEILAQMPALASLAMENVPVPSWTPLARMKSLKHLSIIGAGLHAVPGEILQLPALESLNLSRNKLQALPEALFRTLSLTRVSLSGHSLAKGEIERLRSLYPAIQIRG